MRSTRRASPLAARVRGSAIRQASYRAPVSPAGRDHCRQGLRARAGRPRAPEHAPTIPLRNAQADSRLPASRSHADGRYRRTYVGRAAARTRARMCRSRGFPSHANRAETPLSAHSSKMNARACTSRRTRHRDARPARSIRRCSVASRLAEGPPPPARSDAPPWVALVDTSSRSAERAIAAASGSRGPSWHAAARAIVVIGFVAASPRA